MDGMKKEPKKKRKATPYELECAARLQAIAESRNIGQEAIAEAMGISQGAISHYYTGLNPLNIKRLIGFSKILGCMPNDIDTEARIFDLFSAEDMELFSMIRMLPDDRRRAAMAWVAGYLSAKSA